MKRTAYLVKPADRYTRWIIDGKITCESVGQYASGEMAWQDEDGEQYLLHRQGKTSYFVHI